MPRRSSSSDSDDDSERLKRLRECTQEVDNKQNNNNNNNTDSAASAVPAVPRPAPFRCVVRDVPFLIHSPLHPPATFPSRGPMGAAAPQSMRGEISMISDDKTERITFQSSLVDRLYKQIEKDLLIEDGVWAREAEGAKEKEKGKVRLFKKKQKHDKEKEKEKKEKKEKKSKKDKSSSSSAAMQDD